MDKKKLSTWAKEQNMPYKQAWKLADSGELPVKIERNKKGSIFVMEQSKASKEANFATPVFADRKEETIASVRRNRSATQNPTDQYAHIENGLEVFPAGDKISQGNRSGNNNDSVSPSEAIRLVRKAYYNFADLKNILDVMVEYSSSKLYLRGGNAKSRKFFGDWLDKIKIPNLQDRFFLEHYRSCNTIPCRHEATIKDSDVDILNKTYGCKAAKNVKVPVKYVIIDPSSVIVGGNISFSSPQFYQRLNAYEVQRLIKPVTEEDQNFYDSLPDSVKEQLKGQKANVSINIPLNPENCYFIFHKKQDYEPMAVPMAWPVLKDINWKAEMKALDLSVARTTQRAILVITMGYENKNGEYMFDAKAAEAMRALFESESVGKVLVADFTTKVSWAIPDISKLLGKEKYEQVNEDIRTGLNNILAGSNEKFANQSIKVKLFIQRLVQSREVFLNEFLVPEMKRLGKLMGFRNVPVPYFETLDLKDEDLWNRIVTQLTQMGILTSWEATKAIEDGILPDKEESIESQREYKKLKDEGMYEPVAGGPQTQKEMLDETNKQQEKLLTKTQEHDDKQKTKDRKHAAENPQAPAPQIVLNSPTKLKQPAGKPAGTKTPNTKKKARPMSASLIRDNLLLATKLNTELEKQVIAKFNVKKLDDNQVKLKDAMLETIMMSESPELWNSETVASYIADPNKKNEERFNEVIKVGNEYQVPDYLASILYVSQGAEEIEIEDNE